MERILLLLHTEPDGSIGKAGLEAVHAAREVASGGAAWTIGLVGADVAQAADQLARAGAIRILGVVGAEFTQARYSSDAAAAEALARQAEATLLLAPATSRWNRCLPGVAQRLGGQVDTHVTSLAGNGASLTIHRWLYRQRMEAVVQRSTRPWGILIEPGTFEPWQGASGKAAVEPVTVPVPANGFRSQVTGARAPAADNQTIRPDASLLFVAGAGWTKKQNDGQSHLADAEKLIRTFLNQTRASLGSSKSLVDLSGEGQAVLSFLTHLNQIGQTGSTPRHRKGLSTCCHGEEPHTVGWRFISERRAVSLDPNCGWARGKADVLYVADAFAVMRELNQLLAGGQA